MGPEVLMRRKFAMLVCNRLAGALLLCLLAAAGLRAQSADQYALLRKPTISKTQIAFSYGGGFWVVGPSPARTPPPPTHHLILVTLTFSPPVHFSPLPSQ